MPVAENGLIGAAIGSSIAGSKVLVNLQRVEFSLYAFEQIVNNAAKSFYISRGKHSVPIVIRLVVGRAGAKVQNTLKVWKIYFHQYQDSKL